MLNSIIERHRKITPLSDTEIKVIRSATKLFLTQGFSKTTHRQIAEESGIGLGTITYHYKVKEDMLRVLIEELMDFHLDVIDDSEAKSNDSLFSYAMEIAVQIALCETDDKAYDLYYSAYSHPATFDYIKRTVPLQTAASNYLIFFFLVYTFLRKNRRKLYVFVGFVFIWLSYGI